MPTECCRARAHGSARGRAGSSLTLALGVALALAPKCPMCLAAYLSLFGVSMTAAALIAPWCRPLALAVLLVSAAWWLRARQRTRAGFAHEPASRRRGTDPFVSR